MAMADLAPAEAPRKEEKDPVAEEYLDKLLERHRKDASENDIRSAFRDFLLRTGIAKDEREITTETGPAQASRNRVDLCLRNTYVEFKRNIIKAGAIDEEALDQLDGYLMENARARGGIRNGILTDGMNYLKRSVGDRRRNISALEVKKATQEFNRPQQGSRLRKYLNGIIDTQATNLAPIPGVLTRYFGANSEVFKIATALLTEAHDAHRNHPTVAVKRKLWRDLLQVAIGQNSVDDSPDSDSLYVRHTYLTALVGLIVQARFGIDVARYADSAPARLLSGEILSQHTKLKNITESALFTWPPEIGETLYLGVIADEVARFNWRQNADGLAAALYESAISQEERKRMGEYYTPDWLAQAMADELITDPVHTRVLDPACGSGTFIEAAVKRLIAHSAGMPPGRRLALLQENIAGIDLHPVAVQLAKTTWVIASQDIITEARQAGEAGADITAPIHLGDALQLRYDNSELDAQGYITLDSGEKLAGQRDRVRFQIPLSLARQTDKFDKLMLDLSNAVERGYDAGRVLDNYGVNDPAERQPMETTIAQMRELRDIGRNHVWAYYLRNMTRPVVIAEEKVDAIIGNPPWLTYNQSADIIREELRSFSETRYQIWAGGKNSANQDVAALFYCRAAELYLKAQGKIGMVMPHSVLRNGQHLEFRKGYYETKRPKGSKTAKQALSLDFSIKPPWDLEKLQPNGFFPIVSCVVFAQLPHYRGDIQQHKAAAKPLATSQAPAKVEIWSGPINPWHVQRAVSELIHDDGTFRSPYEPLARRGADIFDRRLYFVTAYPNPNEFAPPDTFVTFPRTGKLDKKTYSVDELHEQIVDGDNLFEVYLGETLAPFVALPPLQAVLPVSKATMTMPLDHRGCPGWPDGEFIRHTACEVDHEELNEDMRARWEIMERLWEANRGKTDKKSLSQNLNWLNKLTNQLDYLRDPGDRPVRIAYATSGRPTAALIEDNQAIIDTKLYQVACRDAEEAYYLLAIINSLALENEVKDFRPKGLYGERDLHKHLWKLPIPEYDAANDRHAELSRLGQSAAREVEERRRKGLGVGRTELRNDWQPQSPTAQAIEAAVGALLAAAGG